MNQTLPPVNLAKAFFDQALAFPDKTAIIEPLQWTHQGIESEKTWTFKQFSDLVKTYQKKLRSQNLKPGERVLILLPPSTKMYALVSALFANGLVPVFIDLSIGKKQFLKSIKLSNVSAVFANDDFFKYRFFIPNLWGTKLYSLEKPMLFVKNWDKVKETVDDTSLFACDAKSECFITFTSGSTGSPKAANRRLDIVYQQRQISHKLWKSENTKHNDIELVGFPMVVFSNLVFGVTSVIPPLKTKELPKIPTNYWVKLIKKYKVNRIVVPPSFLDQICKNHSNPKDFQSVDRMITGGAPVPNWLIEDALKVFTKTKSFVVYGSTEAEPIAFASFNEVIDSKYKGHLVGNPISQADVLVVNPIIDRPKVFEPKQVGPFEVGEVVVSGPHVVENYLYNIKDTLLTKLKDKHGKIWHRTGDTGYLDDQGRIILVGRLDHRIKIDNKSIDVYPIEHDLENLFKSRVGFVKKDDHHTIFIQSKNLSEDYKHKAKKILETYKINSQLTIVDKLPVDKRHFWKVERTELQNKLL